MQRSLFPLLPFVLLIIPILEIGVFILVGGQIGVAYTLLGIILTAMIGSFLLRSQGLALLGQVQREFDQGKVPGKALAHGVMLLVAGLLLLTPGFVTDSIGFLLFVPPVRDGIWSFFASRMTVTSFGAQSANFRSSGRQGTYHSEHFTYRSHEETSNRPYDPSIIDLEEGDFDEVTDRPGLENGKSKGGNSPWGKDD